MTGNEIRETFLRYFEHHGHTRVRSSPLLPANDPTLLFTNAGMNQFKDVFLGLEKRDYVRACSSQKCVRAGGKHNDLDEVGKTARHHTFFEMLGNFSFGDYFKREAIQYAWDFLVKELKLDPERMWFTVFAGDDEVGPDEDAERFWQKVGAPRERILRFGRNDNFWQMGETGPCGPCSEIHYFMGETPSDAENCAANVNAPGDMITELWNLVFMQFDRSEGEPGKYVLTPLPAPSVDTGLGLERLAVVLQGVRSNFDTDLIRPIIDFTAQLADRSYEPESVEGFAMRVIADHARATAFSIADGILPSNEGRNYVLRKIMRRAIYQGRRALDFHDAFFYKVTDFVVKQMHEAYPELEASRDFIEKMVRLEEERFGATLTVGLEKLQQVTGKHELLPLTEAARVYDTYGVPRDLIKQTLEDELRRNQFADGDISSLPDYVKTGSDGKLQIQDEGFNQAFEKALRLIQKTDAREEIVSQAKAKPVYGNIGERVGKSEFTGYEGTRLDGAKINSLIKADGEVSELRAGEEGEVVLDRTPFYAESGGQVGDTGTLAIGSTHVTVSDTVSPLSGLIVHRVKVDQGTLRVGDEVVAQVDGEKRDAIRRNHTATHLLHAALREILGGHVKQAGSVVAPNYLRFDFTHFQPLTKEELADIERIVNSQILRNVNVTTDIMAVEEAIRAGAMALFGEKYSGMMRVLTVPGFSKELCGGTHVRATGDIGLFKIVSDESIASGVRRIRAVTGADAFERFRESELIVDRVASALRTSRTDLPLQVERLQEELKKARR
jgi:alanyl-tRNA synthetase